MSIVNARMSVIMIRNHRLVIMKSLPTQQISLTHAINKMESNTLSPLRFKLQSTLSKSDMQNSFRVEINFGMMGLQEWGPFEDGWLVNVDGTYGQYRFTEGVIQEFNF